VVLQCYLEINLLDVVKACADDERQFVLTAVGELQGTANDESYFDLAAAMTFCQQRWLMITSPVSMAAGTTLDMAKKKLPRKLEIGAHRQGGGPLIMDDKFAPSSQQKFLDLCLRKLQDQSFIQSTGFREAFFRSVEVWRLDPAYIDVTYYLDFSAIEILARRSVPGCCLSFPQAAEPFLQKLGFDLKQEDPTPGRQHNGQTGHTPVVCCVVCDRNIATSRAGLCCPRTDVCCSSTPHGKRRDFFSTHFDINYLPENQARTEALWETSENGGRAAVWRRKMGHVCGTVLPVKAGSVFSRG
jgi:hypothetical protein